MKISEYVSGIEGVWGEDFDEVVQAVGEDGVYMLKATENPGWQFGIVAYGECPQTDGVRRDKTWAVKAYITDDNTDCFLWECAGARITCNGLGDGTWRPGVTVYKVGSTVSLAGTSVLDLNTPYHLAATHDYETGDIKLYIAGVEDNSVGGTDSVETINALPVWSCAAPPGSWVTDGAVWSRVLDPSELPGYVPPPSVTINKATGQADPVVNGSNVVFDVVFSEAVTGFSTGDVTLSGTAGATTGVVAGSGTTYTVTVSGMTANGTVIASIAASVCTSVATGVANAASTSTDNSVDWFNTLLVPGLHAWWDAADSSTINHTTNNVNTWSDKSGNGRTLSGSAPNRPITNTRTLNSLNVLDFQSGGHNLFRNGNTGVDVDDVTIFIVCATDNNPNGGDGFITFHSSTGDDWNRTDSLASSSGNTTRLFQSERNSQSAFISGNTATPAAVYRIVHNGGNINVYKGGVAGTGTSSAGSGTTATGGITVGARLVSGGVGSRMDGYIAEIIVVADGTMAAGDITAIESYLAAKWGV